MESLHDGYKLRSSDYARNVTRRGLTDDWRDVGVGHFLPQTSDEILTKGRFETDEIKHQKLNVLGGVSRENHLFKDLKI